MGFKKGNQLWKLRKTHEIDEERKRKISNTLKKYFNNNSQAKKRISEFHTGRKASEEAKRKRSKSMKELYKKGKIKSVFKKGFKPWNTGLTKENNRLLKTIAENRLGKNNPNWQGGIPYPPEFRKIRNKILRRDLFTCQECHRHQEELKNTLAIHHIDFNKKNNNPKNLITLCNNCHSKTLNSREDWIVYYQEKMIKNQGD